MSYIAMFWQLLKWLFRPRIAPQSRIEAIIEVNYRMKDVPQSQIATMTLVEATVEVAMIFVEVAMIPVEATIYYWSDYWNRKCSRISLSHSYGLRCGVLNKWILYLHWHEMKVKVSPPSVLESHVEVGVEVNVGIEDVL